MTRVQFYHNAPDPLALACELTARAHGGGRRVVLRVADAAGARELDELLWRFDQLAFVPHVMADSPLAGQTPVLIATAASHAAWPHRDVLFNLAADIPDGCEEFRMVVEIVGQSEADKGPARSRWQHYKSRGLPLQAFDAVRREAL
ncbi:MAG TPA: DNA polymerase III subunit chi [Rhodocyclaceae bacterium]|nr:DNA polymerase III subunit chi [Rhodocyclaceae bacterium]